MVGGNIMDSTLRKMADELLMEGFRMFKKARLEMNTLEVKEDRINLAHETRERLSENFTKMYLVEELAKEHFPNQYSDDVLGINVSEYVYLMNKSLDKLLDKALNK
jgi:hypothetical protein